MANKNFTDDLSYSIVPSTSPYGIEDGTTVTVEYNDVGGYEGIPADGVRIQFGSGRQVLIDAQQLMELGSLFLALAGVVGIGFESADTLLEGFSLKGKEAAKKLADALEE